MESRVDDAYNAIKCADLDRFIKNQNRLPKIHLLVLDMATKNFDITSIKYLYDTMVFKQTEIQSTINWVIQLNKNTNKDDVNFDKIQTTAEYFIKFYNI